MSDHIILPSQLPEPTKPCDLTILTVLSGGRHLWYSNIIRDGDDPERMTAAHCAVRKFYHADVEHFIVVTGAGVERVLAAEEVR
jgi:hypothetical protein